MSIGAAYDTKQPQSCLHRFWMHKKHIISFCLRRRKNAVPNRSSETMTPSSPKNSLMCLPGKVVTSKPPLPNLQTHRVLSSELFETVTYTPWLETPFFIGSVLAVFVLFYGLTKKWWIAMITFANAIAIEFLGRKLAFDIIYLWEGWSWTAGLGLTL